jgi:serine/threonine-protein kinase HipA
MTAAQHYELAPAFDVLPSGQAPGFQQMRVGEAEADSTLENALSMSELFALERVRAIDEVRAVARVVDAWQAHFSGIGVSRGDVDLLAEQIDRPLLRDQRREFVRAA